MDILTVDAETFWAKEYGLGSMSPLEYVMDDRFELICLSIKLNDEPTEVVFGHDDSIRALRSFKPERRMVIGHNLSGFDAYILAYRMGIKPRMWGCTMAMARPLHAKTTGLSLAKLVEHYGLGVKDRTVLYATKGKHLADFTDEELDAMRTYNRDDTDQCYALFRKLLPFFSAKELWQIDTVVRMRTEPAFVLDTALLELALSVERDRKLKALLELGGLLNVGEWGECLTDPEVAEHMRSELASADKFCALLESLGIAPPMKVSPTDPDKMIPALAKTDEEFIALQEHENPLVAAAARMRLDVKSTLFETRVEKFLTAGRLAGGRLPIPIRYCGADTTGRDSGEEYNPQNLPRINPDAPKHTDALRRSLRAPDGYKVIVADQSGIELRVNHFLWQVPYSTELFRTNPVADLYRASYAIKLGCAPDEISKVQRHASKVENLGLGFGMGGDKYYDTANRAGLSLSLEQAHADVADWRGRHVEIVKGWKKCHEALTLIESGKEAAIDPGELLVTCSEGIRLPSGRLIRYPELRQEKDKRTGKLEWWYGTGRNAARIYAGKITENCVQALARDSIFDCAVEFYRQTKLRPVLRVHDELVYVVLAAYANELLELLQRIMRTPPVWWPDLVVWSEGAIADTYGEAK